jgi:penicillin-binding protein 2
VRHKPRLVIATQDPMTRTVHPVPVEPPSDLGYKPENVEVVRKALVSVTQDGTAARVFAGAPYLSGGKTGTAQAVGVGQKERYDARKLEEHQRDHALYMAFAPADKPRIALAVVVENAGFGAAHAAPIARRVFDYVLLGQYPGEVDMAAVQKGLAGAPIGQPRAAEDMPALLATGVNGVPMQSAAAKAANNARGAAMAEAINKLMQAPPPSDPNPD